MSLDIKNKYIHIYMPGKRILEDRTLTQREYSQRYFNAHKYTCEDCGVVLHINRKWGHLRSKRHNDVVKFREEHKKRTE